MRQSGLAAAFTAATLQLGCAASRSAVIVQGEVEPGFEEVREEFARNFSEREELGAACAVYYQGRKVVDLWGGWKDEERTQSWERDTMVLVFSTTKGLAAMALALAHSRGLLDYDAKVSRYWPQFAAEGKTDVTVRELLAHQAGLATPDRRVQVADLADPARLAELLERQRPQWTPGDAWGYHAGTLGLYESELLRRVDPQGRTLARYFQEEIAQPLGLEFYIGLPDSVPASRLATVKFYDPLGALVHFPLRWSLSFAWFDSPISRTMRVPFDALPHQRRFYSMPSPSTNGVGEVRSIARAYAVFADGGAELGLGPRTFAQLTAPAVEPRGGPRDRILDADVRYSLGFSKPGPAVPFGSGPDAFGTPGMGGSLGFADPQRRIGFAYAMNRLGYDILSDPRSEALQEAVYRCVRRLEARQRRPGGTAAATGTAP